MANETTNQNNTDSSKAKELGIGLVDYRILRFLRKQKKPVSYRQIADGAPCSYSPLTAVMRADKEGSLCHRGLAKEVMHAADPTSDREVLCFQITAKGIKALEKKAKAVAGTSPKAPKAKGPASEPVSDVPVTA